MFDNIEVNTYTLPRAEQIWREQSQGASQAAMLVAGASTAGFDPEVGPDVAAFLATWSTVAKGISTNVDDVAHGLDEFHSNIGLFENQVIDDITSIGFDFKPDLP